MGPSFILLQLCGCRGVSLVVVGLCFVVWLPRGFPGCHWFEFLFLAAGGFPRLSPLRFGVAGAEVPGLGDESFVEEGLCCTFYVHLSFTVYLCHFNLKYLFLFFMITLVHSAGFSP